MKKRAIVLLLAILCIVSLVGCAPEAAPQAELSAPAATEAAEPSAPAEASEEPAAPAEKSSLDLIKEKGSFTYALSGSYPPFNYIDEETGAVIGFDVDIANALADVIGVKAEAVTTQWDGILGGLTGGRFDTIIGSMAITEARLQEVNFSAPYYYDGAQFFTTADAGYNSIEDLVDGKVGVVTGTTFDELLQTLPNVAEILHFDGDIENFMAVGQGRADGLVTSRFVGLQAPEEYKIVPCGPLLYTENIGIAIRKEDTELLQAINDALKTIVENGTYDEISQKWFGTNILEKE